MNTIIVGIIVTEPINAQYRKNICNNILTLISSMKMEFLNIHFCITNYCLDNNNIKNIKNNNMFNEFLYELKKEYDSILTIRNVTMTESKEYDISKARDIYNKPCKKEIEAYLYNITLETIESIPKYEDSKYIVLIDGTNINDMPVTNLINTLLNPPCEFDALIAYGYDENLEISDKESFRKDNAFIGPEIIGQEFYDKNYLQTIEFNFYHEKVPIKVLSCNGGITIFKKNVIHNRRFSALPTPILDKFYRKNCDRILIPTTYTYNNSAIGIFLFSNVDINSESIFYYNTLGCNYPVVSMFANMFIELHQNGYENIYLYPKLKWVY